MHNFKETILVIDVQGAEEQVLDGAQLTLSKIKFVIIEIAQKNMGHTYYPSFDTILERLTTFGLNRLLIEYLMMKVI